MGYEWRAGQGWNALAPHTDAPCFRCFQDYITRKGEFPHAPMDLPSEEEMSKISNATASEAKEMQKIAKINEASTPNAGTTGEHASCDETLQKGHAHKTQTEFTAKEVVGAAKKATRQQIYGDGDGKFTDNSNPKAREGNTWGVKTDETQGKS